MHLFVIAVKHFSINLAKVREFWLWHKTKAPYILEQWECQVTNNTDVAECCLENWRYETGVTNQLEGYLESSEAEFKIVWNWSSCPIHSRSLIYFLQLWQYSVRFPHTSCSTPTLIRTLRTVSKTSFLNNRLPCEIYPYLMFKKIDCRQFKLAVLACEHPLRALYACMKIP